MQWVKKLWGQLKDPIGFYEGVRDEGWKPAFAFFAWVTFFISILTPILNYLGVASTDFSSSYQSQIFAYNFVNDNLLGAYGSYAYLIEAFLIFTLAVAMVFLLTAFLHLVYRGIGGRGPIMNALKAVCYGIGPCLLGGFLPYVSLFAGFYSFAMQFYIGPMTLYGVSQGRAIVVFVTLIACTFIEMFVMGTTAGF